jgi:hypothetical protein
MHCHGPKGFAVGEAKEVLSLHTKGPWQREAILIFSNHFVLLLFFIFAKHFHGYEERRKEEGEKIEHEENSPNCPFWTYISKKYAHPFLGAWSLLFIYVQFTPSQGPKEFKSTWLRNRTMKV